MTREDIIRMAREVGATTVDADDPQCWIGLLAFTRQELERFAALVAALAQAEPDTYGYASRLAVAIWEKHYKGVAPNWEPLNDLMGVLTQIDNMTAGMTRQEQAESAVDLPSLCSAIAKHLGESWLVVGPDGSRFVAQTPFRAANAANKHFCRLHHDPEEAAKFAAMVNKVRQDSERENDRLMAMYGSLNCPTCGGSGHVGDAALAQQAEPVREPFALPCPTPKACKAHCCSGYCVPPKSPAEPGQAVPCEHCSSPLFAAVQCRVCGRKAGPT